VGLRLRPRSIAGEHAVGLREGGWGGVGRALNVWREGRFGQRRASAWRRGPAGCTPLAKAGRAGGARRTAHRLVERAGRSQEHAREHAASLRKGGEGGGGGGGGGARAERLATGALGATTCERAWKEAHDPAGRSRLVVAFAGAACRTDCAPAMLRSHGWCVARVTPTVQSVTLRVATAWSWSSRAAVGSWGAAAVSCVQIWSQKNLAVGRFGDLAV
jgi:hypothetical protein